MLPVIVRLVAASLIGIGGASLLGAGAQLDHVGVTIVLWSMIAAGTALWVTNVSWNCLACRLAREVRRGDLSERLCDEAPCAQ